MRQEYISDALNMLNDDIIRETDQIREKARRRRNNRWRWAAAAACFVFAVYAGARWMLSQSPADDTSNLPVLTMENRTGDMGYEGLMAYGISELVNGNPWTGDAGIFSLPVYKNPLSRHVSENGIIRILGADSDTMKNFLMDIADRLDMDTDKIEDTMREDEETYVIAEGNGIEIEVDSTMTATITFTPSVSLPDEYNFTYSSSSYEEIEAVAEYLKKTYRDLIDMEEPQANIYGGDYTFERQKGYRIEFFEEDEDLIRQVINYNFNRITFSCDEEGKLWIVRIYKPDLSEKAGDYPIISSEEAAELLENGNYITSMPFEMPGLDHVAKVELVYRVGAGEKYFMPYYRFYVDMPDMEADDGLKTYGIYYVPAVEGKYISDMPVWDGHLN